MKFQKGKSKSGGRAPGTQNRTTMAIKQLATDLIYDPAYQASLKRRMVSGRSPQLEVLMHYYAFGRPKMEVTTDKTIRVIIQRDGTAPNQVIDVRPAIEQGNSPEDMTSI